MPLKMPRVTLMACLLCSCLFGPSSSWALGLGEIHLTSSLNQPMSAEIDLVAAAPDELAALRATLASREAFTRYGIERPPFLSTLTFKVGRSKDGRNVLLVRSTDAIPEPFVTFLVEVNWSRGRLMREYTVLLDPPVYTPGESASSTAPVAGATTAPPATVRRSAPPVTPSADASPAVGAGGSGPQSAPSADSNAIRVGQGDTLSRIARSLHPNAAPAAVDQTMIALYRSNPAAFGGNINLLRRGAILRVPNGDQIAALNQKDAMGEVHRQMDAWRGGEGAAAASGGRLRLVTPTAGSGTGAAGARAAQPAGAAGSGAAGTGAAETQALQDRVKDLESQLAESKRLIDIRNDELSALQRKLGAPAPEPTVPPPSAPPQAAAPGTAPSASAEPPAVVAVPPAAPPATAPAAESGSWIDWVAANWWVPVLLLLLVIGAIVFAAARRRRTESADMDRLMDETDVAAADRSGLATLRKPSDSFVVEESGAHPQPEFGVEPVRFDEAGGTKVPEDTMASDSAVNLDQGDPLAEADFHMAYGLYDQAADLVRIALEREPDRRDLRMKLLEIYFVWGNKDAFLQTAKGLEATRDRAPAGEWDKVLIMGKQICPDEPLFGAAAGSGHGAGSAVDLNLEGGENRVDIDLFGDPEGERGVDHHFAKEADHPAGAGEAHGLHAASGLDFTLDAPERGADDSPTREMPPRDEPTVESELMDFGEPNFLDAPADAPTTESPALHGEHHDRISSKLPNSADQTAEVSIDDLGLDLDSLEVPAAAPGADAGEHPSPDAPTMVAGLDDRSRRLMSDAEREAGGRDAALHAVPDPSPTTRFELDDFEAEHPGKGAEHDKDLESTSEMRGIDSDSIDLDLDQLASALGSGDTVEQPRQAEELFSSDVFDRGGHDKPIDLDVGEAAPAEDAAAGDPHAQTNRLRPLDLASSELEPVTMSEVGTKLDLARAYMDMGDPEGARSILEEVVQEGTAGQKQEATRLMESLPG